MIAATNRSLQKMVKDGNSAKTFTTGSTSSRLTYRRCATGRKTFRCWPSTSPRNMPRRQAAESISPQAMEAMLNYRWPGNIRELENAIERAVVTSRDNVLQVENLPPEVLRRPLRRHPFRSIWIRRFPTCCAT